jgi:predicted membrane protein
MSVLVKILIGLVAGYVIGIALAAIAAFVFDLDEIARFIAIGCGIAGAILGPTLLRRVDVGAR